MPWFSDPDCVSAWLFDGESTGDDAVDFGPIGANDLTDLGAASMIRSASGWLDDCMAPDGTDMLLGLTDANQVLLDLTWGQWTIGMWVKSNGAWPAAADPIFMCKEDGGGDLSYRLFYDKTSKKLTGTFSEDGSTAVTVESDAIPAASTWIHVAWKYDGTTIRMYVDAALQADTASFAGPMNTNAEVFALGGRGDGSLSFRFDGFIDEVFQFKRALTQAEIGNIVNDGLSGPSTNLHDVVIIIADALGPTHYSTKLQATNAAKFVNVDIEIANALPGVHNVDDLLDGEIDVN